MVTERLGVVNVDPVPSELPPVAAAYQLIVAPGEAVALRLTGPTPQLLPGKLAVTLGWPM